jgi:hypothetical protein
MIKKINEATIKRLHDILFLDFLSVGVTDYKRSK